MRSLTSKMVSLVKKGTSSRPGIGGIAGIEPVAMTNLRARTRTRPASTVNLSRKLALAWMTRTPSPVMRSMESFGAIAAMTL